jgi:hypothetical protein
VSQYPFGGFDDEIAIAAEILLKSWWSMLSVREPWSDTPMDDAYGMMRPVLSELLNEGRDCDRRERTRRMMLAARKHGAFRRGQRFTPRSLQDEFDSVLNAAEAVMSEHGLSTEYIADVLVLLERDVRLALDASLAGWMRSISSELSENP